MIQVILSHKELTSGFTHILKRCSENPYEGKAKEVWADGFLAALEAVNEAQDIMLRETKNNECRCKNA